MPEPASTMHPDLAALIERDRLAVAQGYQTGDVNHYVQPIIGLLRLRLDQGQPVTTSDVEAAIEALTQATRAEIALLAYLHPEQYEHTRAPTSP